MNRIRFSIIMLSLVFIYASSAFAQRASVEELATMTTPTNEDGTRAGDGNRKVIQKGNTLYVLNYWIGLQTLDISNPKAPKELSVFRTSSRNFNFLLDDQKRIFIASEESGVYVVDASNPANLKMIGRVKTENDAYAIALDGTTLAVAQGNSPIEIFDISDIKNPAKLGEIPVNSWVWAAAFVSGRLYAGNKDCCLYVYDISTPANPQILDHVNMSQVVKTIKSEKNFVYLAAGPGGVMVFDASNPDTPKELSRYETGGYIYDIYKSGDFIYAANEKLSALQIISVEDPKNPELVYKKDFKSKVYGVTKQSGSVYVAADKETYSMRYNNAPRLEPIGDQKVDENSTLVIKAKGSDPDYDAVYISMDNLPEGAKFDSVDTFTWTPNYEQSGLYKGIVVTVTEKTESKLTAVEEFSIFVNHVNRPPVLADVESTELDENQPLKIVIPTGSDPDIEDKGLLKYRIENLPEFAEFDSLGLVLSWTPTYDQSGEYDLIAVLKDPSGLEARSPFKVTVNHVDRPPVVENVAPQFTVDENSPLTITFKGSDPDVEDKDIYQWSAINLPDGATFDKKTLTISWTPNYEQSGLYEGVAVFLQTNDKKDSTAFSIKVNHVNRPPVLNDVPTFTANEDDSLKFKIDGSDPDKEDNGKLVFSAENLPDGAIFNPGLKEFSWLPGFDQSGTYQVDFLVTDFSGLFSKKTTTLTINHVNRPPVLDTLATQTVDENKTLNFMVVGNDPDKEDQDHLKISAANLPDGAKFDAGSNQFSWLPNYEQSGNYSVNFTLDDGAGAKDDIKVDIVVNHVNRSPVLESIAEQKVDENKLIKFLVKGSDPDKEDKKNLKITAVKLPEGSTFNEATSEFLWTPNFDQSGLNIANFKIDDGAGLTSELAVNILVNNVNRTPVWEYQIEAVNADEDKPISLVLKAATDPDKENKDNLVYSVDNLPKGAEFNANSRTFNWTPAFNQSGKYAVEFKVSDGQFELKKKLDITVNNVNRSPLVTVQDVKQAEEDQNIEIKVDFSDPDAEDQGKLTAVVEGLPNGAKFDKKSGLIEWKPNFDQAGSYSLKVIVKDPGGLQVDKSFTIEVKDKNRNPEISVSSPGNLKEGDNFSHTITATDPDKDDLQFSFDGSVPSGMMIDSKNGTVTWPNSQPGNYTVSVVVKDGKGGEAAASFELSVEAKPPVPEQPQPKTDKESQN